MAGVECKTYYRSDKGRHNVPDILPLFLGIEMVGIVICVLGVLVSTILSRGVTLGGLICFGVLLILIGHGVFCDNYYNWHECVRYEISNFGVYYIYNLNNIVPSNQPVRIELKSIESYTVHKDKVTLKGEFRKKPPIGKTVTLNKITLQIDLDDKDKILDAFNKLAGRG